MFQHYNALFVTIIAVGYIVRFSNIPYNTLSELVLVDSAIALISV